MTRAQPRAIIQQPDGETYRFIPLTQGKVAIVDAEDYDRLMEHPWCAHQRYKREQFVAVRNSLDGENGKSYTILMHCEALRVPRGTLIDHENLNSLDNRKDNLRLATPQQNGRNRGPQKNNSSGFKGVDKPNHTWRWRARIKSDSGHIHLGYFDTKEEAAQAYRQAADKLHGEFARY